MFSLKASKVMKESPLGYRLWAVAIDLLTINIRSVSNMKVRRDLKVV